MNQRRLTAGCMVRGGARPVRLSADSLTAGFATALARAAADDQPAFVVLVLDDQGLLLAVRQHEVPPAEAEDSCRTLLRLLGKEGRGPAVVVTVKPGTEDLREFVSAWPDVAAAFAESDASLLDWLLAREDETCVSIASIAEQHR